jgi:hypothetical protein
MYKEAWGSFTMRFILIAIIVTLWLIAPASAQTPSCEQAPASTTHPYGFDPYKPSDATLLRDYGATLVAHTPLQELRRLDPYKPSDAALLRALGGAFPLWGLEWYWAPVPAPLTPFAEPERWMPRAPAALPPIMQTSPGTAPESAGREAVTSAQPSVMASLRPPENNDGIWIAYAEKRWILDGRPVPYDSSAFQRVGEYDSFPVFRRTGVDEDVIYVPTRQGALAPYRLKR